MTKATVLRVLIADDEALARKRLRRLLAVCHAPGAVVAGEAANAAQVLASVQREAFDLLLLDIGMPGDDGLRVAAAVRALAAPPAVVFVTAHAEHAWRAFELDAVDYLTKPVRLQRLQEALQKVRRAAQARAQLDQVAAAPPPSLLITAPGLVKRIAVSEVLYLKAELKYVTVATAAGNYVFDGSLNQLEESHSERFLRIHRNALVARAAIAALRRRHTDDGSEGWVVRVAGLAEELAVSRRQVAAVRCALGQIEGS